jgi:hypothetical protein
MTPSSISFVRYSLNMYLVCEISGSHGGEYEEESHLGYTVVQPRWCRPMFPLKRRYTPTKL